MAGGIFLVQEGGGLVEMTERPYASEDILQELLEKYPRLLSGDRSEGIESARWLLIAREAPVPSERDGVDRWAVDHLFVDQNAVPTLVEVKRSSDTRIRREVVGQMLDYAANGVVYWPVESLIGQFQQTCQRQQREPEDVLAEFLGDDGDPSEFWRQVQTNLQAGKVRMLFVADAIPSELKRIVEFLNQQMSPAEVLAVEVRQFVGEGVRALVPRMVGDTAIAQQKKNTPLGPKRNWDENSFLEELETRHGLSAVSVVRRILRWSDAHMPEIRWGDGPKSGSATLRTRRDGTWCPFMRIYTEGYIEFQFRSLQTHPPFDSEQMRLELLLRLNENANAGLPPDAYNKFPGARLSCFQDERHLEGLLATIQWALEQLPA